MGNLFSSRHVDSEILDVEMIHIQLHTTIKGMSEEFEISANSSIFDLKKKIRECNGVPEDQHRLVIQATEIVDSLLIKDCRPTYDGEKWVLKVDLKLTLPSLTTHLTEEEPSNIGSPKNII
jgi:hypothetical protein